MTRAREKILITILVLIMLVVSLPIESIAAASKEKMNLTAEGAIAYCPKTGEVIFSKNPDTKMVPASTTKLMTALLAVEQLDMNQVITTDLETKKIAETQIYMKVGEKFTVRDLLYAMLVSSANDAAVALAKAVAGNVDDFAVMMNERAKKIGAKNTHFVNPNGIKVPGHYSTAHDLALIAKEAFDNKTIRKIAGTQEYTIKATEFTRARELENTNSLILSGETVKIDGVEVSAKYKGVFAGKTGTWNDDEASLVLGLNSKGMEIITVILNSTVDDRYKDAIKLLKYAEKNVARYVACKKGDSFGKAFVRHGKTCRVNAIASKTGYIHLPEGVSEKLVRTEAQYYEDLQAPLKKGTKVGKLLVYMDEEQVDEFNLVAADDVEEGWFPSYIGISNHTTIIVGIIAIIILGAFLILICISRKKKQAAEKKRQEKIEAIARKNLEREEDLKRRNWPTNV